MRDEALQVVAARAAASDGKNLLREYLQSRVLRIMQAQRAFIPLAFMGGTALRFRYGVARFSEDLDFTVERGAAEFDFGALLASIGRGLEREGYTLGTLEPNTKSAVHKAMISFPGLLYEAQVSPHADQQLRIKLEVDTNPPTGAVLETFVIRRLGPIQAQFHDLPSLFAGKTAAVLAREYTKGRDFYDLWWYLTRDTRLEPNLELLANALKQTAPELAPAAEADWVDALRTRLPSVNWDDVWRDVAPFLEDSGGVRAVFSAEAFLDLLGERGA